MKFEWQALKFHIYSVTLSLFCHMFVWHLIPKKNAPAAHIICYPYDSSVNSRWKLSSTNIGSLLLLTCSSAPLLAISMWYIEAILGPLNSDTEIVVTLLILLFSSGFSLAINKHVKSYTRSMTINLGICIMLLVMNSFDSFLKKSAGINHLGSFKADLALDLIGCELFKENSFEIPCDHNKLIYKAKDILVLWKGSEYHLSFLGSDQKNHYLTLPASRVLAVSFLQENA